MASRLRPGEVRDAIHAYLREIKGDASILEIQAAVNERLGTEVPTSSVRSSLRLSSLFEQTARGRYRRTRP